MKAIYLVMVSYYTNSSPIPVAAYDKFNDAWKQREYEINMRGAYSAFIKEIPYHE